MADLKARARGRRAKWEREPSILASIMTRGSRFCSLDTTKQDRKGERVRSGLYTSNLMYICPYMVRVSASVSYILSFLSVFIIFSFFSSFGSSWRRLVFVLNYIDYRKKCAHIQQKLYLCTGYCETGKNYFSRNFIYKSPLSFKRPTTMVRRNEAEKWTIYSEQ